MNNETETLGDEQRGEILQKSPFLKVYLDTSEMVLNNEKWKNDFDQRREEAIKDISKDLGPGWLEQVMFQRHISLRSSFFNPSLPPAEMLEHSKNLILFGYQVKSPELATLILPELTIKLRMDDVLNPQMQDRTVIDNYIREYVIAGASMNQKSLTPGESQGSS